MAVALLAALPGCETGSAPAFTVGRWTLTERDIALRDKVIRIYYPRSSHENGGATQLLEAYLVARILEDHGVSLDRSALELEARRIQANTKDAATLSRIKTIFSGDEAAYYRVFVLPTLATRSIYFDFFLNDPKLQAAGKKAAEECLVALRGSKNPKNSLAEWGRRRKVPRNRVSGPDASVQWLAQVPPSTRPGQIIPHVIDAGDEWQVALYEKQNGVGKQFEILSFPKADFQSWLDAEKSRVRRDAFRSYGRATGP